MTTNSVVPMPKAPMARARSARGTAVLQGTRVGSGPADCVVLVVPVSDDSLQAQARAAGRHALRAACVCSHGGTLAGPRTAVLRGPPPVARRRVSGLQQHLHGAVLLLAEVHVRLRCLLQRDAV